MSISAHACALDAHEHFHGQDGITCACAHEHRDEENPRKLVVAILLFALGFGLYYSINTGFAASLNGVLSGILPSAPLAAIVSFLPSEDPVSSEFAPYFVFTFAILVVAYLLSGLGVLKIALKNAMRGEFFDENFLMSAATLGAFALGAYPEAAAVMIFYAIGERFEHRAAGITKKSLAALLAARPDLARVRDGEKWTQKSAKEVKVGQIILVGAGEKVPLDGVIAKGESEFDTAMLTGESRPKSAGVGDAALCGFINLSGELEIKVTKPYSQSSASKIIDLVQNAASCKAPSEKFITKFARVYTPIVVFASLALAVLPPVLGGGEWDEWIRRALVFLVISCPCALVLSVPLTYFAGIGRASEEGILIKGGSVLHDLSAIKTAVFDKTGTLTKGEFALSRAEAAAGFDVGEVLAFAAAAEKTSSHPVAKALVASSNLKAELGEASEVKEIAGLGVKAVVNGREIAVGNEKLMKQIGAVPGDFKFESEGGVVVFVSLDGALSGAFEFVDALKDTSGETIATLREKGIFTAMLTGDTNAAAVAKKLGLDEYADALMPADKLARLEGLMGGGKTVFVGDGINDAPAIARADVGVAFAVLGADAAVEAADVALMSGEPAKFLRAYSLSCKVESVAKQNVAIAIGLKLVFLGLGAFGVAGLWLAVFGDVGVMILAVGNALRVFKM